MQPATEQKLETSLFSRSEGRPPRWSQCPRQVEQKDLVGVDGEFNCAFVLFAEEWAPQARSAG
jgi:hypothetical protein